MKLRKLPVFGAVLAWALLRLPAHRARDRRLNARAAKRDEQPMFLSMHERRP